MGLGSIQRSHKLHTQLVAAGLKTATATLLASTKLELSGYQNLLITLDVTVAERDSGDELYDVYIATGDGLSEWDMVHFPQIATTGAKRFTARILSDRLAEVTTATPGVAAEPSATFKTDTAGSNEGSKTLAAGKVRHGPFGDYVTVYLVVAGTVATGIDFSVLLTAG